MPDIGPEKKWIMRIDRWHPARLNQLLHCHWVRRARLKSFDADVVALAVLGAGVPIATLMRRVSLEIVLGPRQRGGDPDAYWKSLLDALVKCGALHDDSKTWCQLGEVTFQRNERWGTVIVLENLYAPDRILDIEAAQLRKHHFKLCGPKIINRQKRVW